MEINLCLLVITVLFFTITMFLLFFVFWQDARYRKVKDNMDVRNMLLMEKIDEVMSRNMKLVNQNQDLQILAANQSEELDNLILMRK